MPRTPTHPPNATATSNGVLHGTVTGVPRAFREPGIQAPDPAPSGTIPPIPRWDANPELISVDTNAQPGTTVIDADAGFAANGGLTAQTEWTHRSFLGGVRTLTIAGLAQSGVLALDFARRAEDAGAGTIIYTDIATDGMLEGPNFAETEKMLAALQCQLIASGGVGTADHVLRLAQMPGLYGCIIGKALYDGKVSLADVRAGL